VAVVGGGDAGDAGVATAEISTTHDAGTSGPRSDITTKSVFCHQNMHDVHLFPIV